MSRFLNPKYAGLCEYVPGEQPQDRKYIKLNTNESPYPPSSGVIAAVRSAEVENLRLYCDPDCGSLKESFAELYGVKTENILFSNGSDDILNFAFMAFTADGAAFPDITYGFYKVLAQLHSVDYVNLPLKDDFSLNPADYFGAGRMVVIANPNAPTGIALSLFEVEEIVKSNPDNVVLIDEAYVDFGCQSAIRLTEKYDNLLVVGTFSKSRSMAGARLGFAVASNSIISDLEKFKNSTNPYNVNRLTQAAGIAAVRDNDYYIENCRQIIETREYTANRLFKMGFRVLPSSTNFLFAAHENISGKELYKSLKAKGVLVRHFEAERIRDFNRITIGSREEMEIFLAKTQEILGGKV